MLEVGNTGRKMDNSNDYKLGKIMQELRSIDKNISEIKDDIKSLNQRVDKEFNKVDEKISTKLEGREIRSIIRDEIKKCEEEKLNKNNKRVSMINGLIGIGKFLISIAGAFVMLKYLM